MAFDLDGTLVDSRRDLAESANAVLEECGAAPHSEDEIGRMVGDGAAALIARAFAATHVAQPDWALARFLEIYDSRPLRHTRAYDGILDVLAALQGRATLAVLTNKPIAPTRVILDALGFAPFFAERVLGGDGPHPRKPDPQGLHLLIDAARTHADATLLVGDSIIDWQTASSAGATCALAEYGFGAQNFPRNRLRSQDFGIQRPLDLLPHL